MIARLVLLLLSMFLAVQAHATITLSLSASKPATCVAPCYVFFDASATTSTATTVPFHEIEYRWNFGDAAAKRTWSYGAQSAASRNEARGPIAGHIYEAAGTYTVTLLGYDGTVSANTTTSVTVTSAAATFATTDTICVSTSSNFNGCPASATQGAATADFASAVGYITGTKKRLLFRCGETWTTAGAGPQITLDGPGIIGAYNDSGVVSATNTCTKPIIRATADSSSGMLRLGVASQTHQDWRVMDLSFDGNGNTHTVGIESESSLTAFNQFIALRLDFTSMEKAISLPENTAPFDQVAIVDNTVTSVIGPDATSGYGYFLRGTKMFFSGNSVSGSNGIHGVRTGGQTTKIIACNNTVTAGRSGGSVWKFDGPNFGVTGGLAQYGVICDNRFVSVSNATILAIAPTNSTADERIKDIIVERNWMTAGSTVSRGVWVSAKNVTVRSNIIDMTTGTASGRDGVTVEVTGVEPAADLVWIYNNTFYNPDTSAFSGTSHAIGTFTGVTNVTAKNNLGYAKNSTSPVLLSDGCSCTTVGGNSTNVQVAGTNPFVAAVPATPVATDFMLSTAYAKNGGTSVPVWTDFGRRIWPTATAAWDIGAWSTNVKTRGAACATAGC